MTTMANVSNTWYEQGRYEEVEPEPLAIQILEFRREALSAKHIETLITMYDLAHTL